MKTRIILILFLTGLISNISFALSNSIEYLGQTPPKSVPIAFGVSYFLPNGYMNHGVPVMSPDGNEIYFSLIRKSDELHIIMFIKKKNDTLWSNPELAPFSGKYNDDFPFFSYDGMRLYFCSDRRTGIPGRKKFWFDKHDIWYVEKEGTNWSDPKIVNIPATDGKVTICPSVSENGNIFFTGEGNYDGDYFGLWFSKKVNDTTYLNPELIGTNINSKGRDWTPFISPNEDYLIFSSNRNDLDKFTDDLFISYKLPNDTWTIPVSMGDLINTSAQEKYPMVSHDGDYLFFVRSFGSADSIYWVSSEIIDEIKNETNINQK